MTCELRREAWGRTEVASGARTSTPIRFQGQYEDPETGLCYNRFRYYDPEAGRFVSSDPIGLLGGVNIYAYVRNPLRWLDPLGLADPGLPELIAAFEKTYPDRPYSSGHARKYSDGRELEIDFETDNAIIEVKGDAGKGLGRQVKDRRDCTINPQGKPVIGYSASSLGKHSRSEIEKQGGIAADKKDLDVLMAAIAPDPK